ncbi:hypothetical protein GMSM_10130 [Geomonas sp. Red276]
MEKIGRNDCCPCGSGKKYKKCCLPNVEAREQARRDEESAARRVLDWLGKRYSEEMMEAVQEGFFGGFEEDELAILDEMGPELNAMVDMNMGEWSLADAMITVGGKRVAVRKLVLGAGGPLLPAPARLWFQQLVEHPMGLYEVRRAEPGRGLELADLLRPGQPNTWVDEEAASQSLLRWDTFGARLVHNGDGWVLSGALYPLEREDAHACRAEILSETEGIDWDTDEGREIISTTIIDYWLSPYIAEGAAAGLEQSAEAHPQFIDRYRVTDWDALEEALEAQPEVRGNREDGWLRLKKPYGLAVGLNETDAGGINLFGGEESSANEARGWFEGLAGDAVVHERREVLELEEDLFPETGISCLPPEVESSVVNDMMANRYRRWIDEKLPSLGGQSPREAVATPEGRRGVVEMLKEFELAESRRAWDEDAEPFDFGFIWEILGLSPDEDIRA